MIGQILAKLGLTRNLGDGSLNAEIDTRRKFIRYTGLQAEIEVAGQSFSVRDWSLGGVAFETLPDSRLLVGDRVNFTLRFRFPHDVISIEQKARIVRTGRKGAAAEFIEPTPESRRGLQRALDGHNAQGFLQSQVA